MSDVTQRLLRVAEVAERLNCSLATVYVLVESGKLGHYRCPGVRISEQQLQDYMDARKRGRESGASRPKRTRPKLRHIQL